MTHQWQPGDIARAHVRYPMQHPDQPGAILSTSTYRVDAVRHGRCYVTHLTGGKHAQGIAGWSNQWFAVDDERIEYVEAPDHA